VSGLTSGPEENVGRDLYGVLTARCRFWYMAPDESIGCDVCTVVADKVSGLTCGSAGRSLVPPTSCKRCAITANFPLIVWSAAERRKITRGWAGVAGGGGGRDMNRKM
jgi:hypothetical protein